MFVADWSKGSHDLIIALFKVDEFYPRLAPVFNNRTKISIESAYLSCLIFREINLELSFLFDCFVFSQNQFKD